MSRFSYTLLSRVATLAVWLLAIGPTGAGAQSSSIDTTPIPPSARQWFELSAGVDGTSSAWSTYSSLTAALMSDIHDNGYRLRIGGGFGRYRYTRPDFDPNSRRQLWSEFFGEQRWSDVLIGYQWSFGPTTLKAYTGITEEQHRISPGPATVLDADDGNIVQGGKRGTKLVLETWTRLAEWGFFQADANWSEPFEAYGGRVRLGYFVGNGWSTGLEVSAFGNFSHDAGRAGAFGRYTWQAGEFSFSAGLDSDLDRIGGGHASFSITTRF